MQRLHKWMYRNPALATSIASFVLVFVLGLVGILSQWCRARTNEATARRTAYAAEMSLAYEALEHNHLGRARELLGKYRPKQGIDLRGWEWRHLWERTKGDDLFTLAGHSSVVTAALFLLDGRSLVSTSDDGTLRFWDILMRTNTQTIHNPGGGWTGYLALSPNGRWLAVGGTPWRLYDTDNRQLVYAGTNLEMATGVTFSADGQWLAIATGSTITVLDATTQRTIETISRNEGEVDRAYRIGVAFSCDGSRLAYGHADDTIRLHNLTNHSEMILPSSGHGEALNLALTHDGHFLVAAHREGMDLWDITTTNFVRQLTGHRADVNCVILSPNGHYLASASADQTIKLWDTRSWTVVETLHGHEMEVQAVAFSPDGNFLVSGGWDQLLRVWDLRQFPSHRECFRSVENVPFNWPFPHGDRLVLVHGNLPYALPAVTVPQTVLEALRRLGNYGAVSYLNCLTLQESSPEQTPPSFSSAFLMAFGPNAKSVAVGWTNGVIEFWKTQPFRRIHILTGSTNAPWHLAYSANGQQLSVHRADDTVEIWDLPKGVLVRRLPPLANLLGGPNCEFWAHDHILARAASWIPSVIELWHLPQGKRQAFVHNQGGLQVWTVSNDGRLLATSSWDGILRLWDVQSGQQFATIRGQLKTYCSLVFSPDDTRLLAGGHDGTITVWVTATLQQVAYWKAHERLCVPLRFVAGDQAVYSLGDSDYQDRWQGIIRLWRAPTLTEISAWEKAHR